jgi:hypothetical protein
MEESVLPRFFPAGTMLERLAELKVELPSQFIRSSSTIRDHLGGVSAPKARNWVDRIREFGVQILGRREFDRYPTSKCGNDLLISWMQMNQIDCLVAAVGNVLLK